MKELAVILPVYRYDNISYFKNAVESLLSQDFLDFDLLIFQDGPVSTEIAEYLENLNSDNIVIIRFKINEGLPAILNKAIRYCLERNYAYIARMDADDISAPDRLSKQISYLNKIPKFESVGTSAYIINSRNEIVGSKLVAHPLTYKVLRRVCDIIHPSVMFKASFFRKVGFYDESLLQSQDYDLWFRAINKNIKIANIREKLYYLRYDKNLVARRKKAQRYVLKIKRRYLKKWEYPYLLVHLLIYIMPKFMLEMILRNKINKG